MNKHVILFPTLELSYPPAGGPSLRIHNSIKALSRIADLHVVCRTNYDDLGGRQAVSYYRRICHRFLFAPGKGPVWRLLLQLASKRFPVSNRVAYFANLLIEALDVKLRNVTPRDEAAFLIRYVRRHRIRTIWFGYGNTSYPLIKEIRRRAPDLRLVCDTDSVWSRFILRALPYESDPDRRRSIEEEGRAKEREEMEWVNLCDITTAVSEVDAAYYRSLATDPGRIRIFSNAIDPEMYQDPPSAPPGFKSPSIYLAGSFGPGSPMDHAARWILDHVLPRLTHQYPNLHFYIVGKDSDRVLSDINSDRVTITGRVESVLPYLCNADVILVPLWFESGTRFKILEAGACKKAIVSTTLGAEGIPITHGHDGLIIDTPEDFANAIADLIHNPSLAQHLGQNLYELVSSRYSLAALAEEGERILEAIEA